MARWKQVLREALAAVVGYAVIVALTTLGLEVWMEGVELWGAGLATQLQATFVAVVSGLAGGAVAALVGGRPLRDAALVLIFLVLDTAYVVLVFESPAPTWFRLMGSVTLMAATLAGGLLVAVLRRRRKTLLAGVTEENGHPEVDFGRREGKESW